MKHNYYAPGKENPHLPHDGIELKSMPVETALARREADLLVSQLLEQNTKPSRPERPAQPTASARPKPSVEAELVSAIMKEARPAQEEAQPEQPAEKVVPRRPVEIRDEATVTNDLREAFPKLSAKEAPDGDEKEAIAFFDRFPPVYFVGLGLVAMLVMKPMLALWTIVVVAGFIIGAAALLKVPGLSSLCAMIWKRFVRRSPGRAERVRRVADRAAMGFESMLDVLPGSLADKLSLPDLSEPVTPKR